MGKPPGECSVQFSHPASSLGTTGVSSNYQTLLEQTDPLPYNLHTVTEATSESGVSKLHSRAGDASAEMNEYCSPEGSRPVPSTHASACISSFRGSNVSSLSGHCTHTYTNCTVVEKELFYPDAGFLWVSVKRLPPQRTGHYCIAAEMNKSWPQSRAGFTRRFEMQCLFLS